MIGRYLNGILAALALLGAAMLYRKGRTDEQAKADVEDYENAEDIRRRVFVDRAARMRELDDAGWRD